VCPIFALAGGTAAAAEGFPIPVERLTNNNLTNNICHRVPAGINIHNPHINRPATSYQELFSRVASSSLLRNIRGAA